MGYSHCLRSHEDGDGGDSHEHDVAFQCTCGAGLVSEQLAEGKGETNEDVQVAVEVLELADILSEDVQVDVEVLELADTLLGVEVEREAGEVCTPLAAQAGEVDGRSLASLLHSSGKSNLSHKSHRVDEGEAWLHARDDGHGGLVRRCMNHRCICQNTSTNLRSIAPYCDNLGSIRRICVDNGRCPADKSMSVDTDAVWQARVVKMNHRAHLDVDAHRSWNRRHVSLSEQEKGV